MSDGGNAEEIRLEIFSKVRSLISDETDLEVKDETPLIGPETALNSMKLVELCLALEDKAAFAGFEFDWTSESAMSQSRSMFRTAGSLADEYISQMNAKR